MTHPNDITISDLQVIDPKSIIGKGMSGLFYKIIEMRWARASANEPHRLQQALANDRGDIKWEDVPTWDEASGTWVG